MTRYLLIPVALLVLLVAACAPASTSTPAPAAAPTVDAMMKNPTPTTEAMMAQGTGTPEAMTVHATGTPDAMMPKGTPGAMMDHLPEQVKTPHLVDSTPKQGDQLTHAPDKVVVNFDAALGAGSNLAVTRDGAPVDIGRAMVDDKTLSATLPMVGPGVYVVKYKACWAGGMCDDGQFAFEVEGESR